MSIDLQAEISKLKQEKENDEKKSNRQLVEDIKKAEQETKEEIENESTYLRDCLVIEISKIRQEVEQNIDKLNKERYKNFGAVDELANKYDNKEVTHPPTKKKSEKNYAKELEKERERFEKESRERQARFEAQLQRLYSQNYKDEKQIEKLKKEVLPIVNAKGFNKITDESTMDRYRIKITRNAIRTGDAWALYKSTYQDKSVLCRVTTLIKVPLEIRRELNSSAKIVRVLCEKPARSSFVKIYEIFATEEKIYFLMDEYSPISLSEVIRKGQGVENNSKWIHQLTETFAYMHNIAIGHLNIRSENVIFDKDQNVKLIGLGRTFLYFSLDQETILKAPKVPKSDYNDHLPPECFEESFNPEPADVWSFGLLIYEIATKTNPIRSKTGFKFQNITDEIQQNLVKKMLSPILLTRPKFDKILQSDYFKSNTQRTPSKESSSNEKEE